MTIPMTPEYREQIAEMLARPYPQAMATKTTASAVLAAARALWDENERLAAERDEWHRQNGLLRGERNVATARAEKAEAERDRANLRASKVRLVLASIIRAFRGSGVVDFERITMWRRVFEETRPGADAEPAAAAQHPASGAEGDGDAMGTPVRASGPDAGCEAAEEAPKAWLPHEVPDALVRAVLKPYCAQCALTVGRTPYSDHEQEVRDITAAVLTQLGLRPEWRYRWRTRTGDERISLNAMTEEHARRRVVEGRTAGDHTMRVVRRYVTNWEDL